MIASPDDKNLQNKKNQKEEMFFSYWTGER